jgi:integrase
LARRHRRRTVHPARDDEYQRFLEAAPNDLYRDLFVIMRHAGLRVSEAVGLRWEQVDLDALQLEIRGKGQVERYVDILSPVESVLRRRIRADTPYVFPGPTGYPLSTRAVQLVMQKIRERLGIPRNRGTPHKLRHRYATWLVENGVPLSDVRDQLGHANIATTSVYLHSTPGRVRKIMEARSAPPTPLVHHRVAPHLRAF